MRRSRQVLVLVAALALCSMAVAETLLASFLPQEKSLGGWTIIEGADSGGSSDEVLYGLYDGAVPQMREEKIVAAWERVYKKGDKRLTMDIFQFGTAAQAKTYYLKRREALKAATGVFTRYPKVKTEAYVGSVSGVTSGAGFQRIFVYQVNTPGAQSSDRITAKSFLSFTSGRIKAKYD